MVSADFCNKTIGWNLLLKIFSRSFPLWDLPIQIRKHPQKSKQTNTKTPLASSFYILNGGVTHSILQEEGGSHRRQCCAADGGSPHSRRVGGKG
jgi:hypothetical protein